MTYSLVGWIHIGAAFAALGLGFINVVMKKGTPLHRLVGVFYVFAMLALNGAALSIYDMTGHFGIFHALAIFSLFCVAMGLWPAIFRKGEWIYRHYMWMGWSYFGLLAAAFAETMIRVPAFHVNSVARGFEVAIGASIVFSLFGGAFMKALGRSLPPRKPKIA
ncbi:MAG: DUF2306 domain-containing protein [Rhizomicrobium sp.]|jgi:uncharacterized membrane protein